MFLSKIWFFLVAAVAATAVTFALLMPRPAERDRLDDEHRRLVVACGVVDILLTENARSRVELTGTFARAPQVVGALEKASGAAEITADASRAAEQATQPLFEQLKAGAKGISVPDFAWLVDRRGRVLARTGTVGGGFGDVVAGRPLVDDALAGYLRDDLWREKGQLFLVAAAPVVNRDGNAGYVGAVVLGHAVRKELADRLVGSLDVELAVFTAGQVVASSSTAILDHAALSAALPKDADRSGDCKAVPPLTLRGGQDTYAAVAARLPGDAARLGAFYSVFVRRGDAMGFAGTLGALRKDDLGFSNFPWIFVGIGFVVALAIGVFLMLWEADLPLRRLGADAVKLAKGETDRLSEDAHAAKFGSIARSINIALDKVHHDARAAKQDLDQLLGPAPEGALGAADLLAAPLPMSARSQPAIQTPVSEFRFTDAPKPAPAAKAMDLELPPSPAAKPAAPPARPAAPPPIVARPTPPPMAAQPVAAPPPAAPPKAAEPAKNKALDEELTLDDVPPIAAAAPAAAVSDDEDDFQRVFDEYVALKTKCGESTTGLTFAKFGDKLRKNRDDLMAKTGCQGVKFTVYVKDGKAMLKASPVK